MPSGEYPCPGYPLASTGWGTPWPGQYWVPSQFQPGQDGVSPSPGDRTVEPVLATRRAVCLLRSRRRTVLLSDAFSHFM